MSQDAIIIEIESQIQACNSKLEKETIVSKYVEILKKKREWEALLKQEIIKKVSFNG